MQEKQVPFWEGTPLLVCLPRKQAEGNWRELYGEALKVWAFPSIRSSLAVFAQSCREKQPLKCPEGSGREAKLSATGKQILPPGCFMEAFFVIKEYGD